MPSSPLREEGATWAEVAELRGYLCLGEQREGEATVEDYVGRCLVLWAGEVGHLGSVLHLGAVMEEETTWEVVPERKDDWVQEGRGVLLYLWGERHWEGQEGEEATLQWGGEILE